jgi:arylsulfatase
VSEVTWLEPNFRGRIGRTLAESEPAWRPAPEHGNRPNVLMVVLDDTGWSDLGCFGSPIRTPAIDSLAQGGLRYTNFHVAPLCSPTRASLLTGRNHHSVGMRFLADADTGFPNSRGHVHFGIPMFPQILRENGYGTYLVGKWHLTPLEEVTPAGPFQNWPLGRGFERFYGFLDGCTDHYAPELFEDNHQIAPPQREGYHLSEDLADHAIEYLTNHAAYRGDAPFYLHLAMGATHAPFQAPREYIDRYLQTFARGWDTERIERLERQIELRLLPGRTRLTERDEDVPPWDDLDGDARTLFTHLQAAFAGFLEHADAQIGRVLEAIGRLGRLENTIVIVMSDNGASREGGPVGAVNCNAPYSGHQQSVAEQLAQLEKLGGPEGPAHYPQGWAMAGNTPFRKYKQYVDLGGVRSPLVLSWPRGLEARGGVRHQFVHVTDIMPTLLELAGIPAPQMDGRDFSPSLEDPEAAETHSTQHWEMLGHRGIWHEGWKAVTAHVPGTDFDEEAWRLYHVPSDPSESTDLAAQNPDLLEELKRRWWKAAEEHHVLPLDDRPLVQLLELRSPRSLSTRDRVVLPAGAGHVPFSTGLTGSERSMRITAALRAREAGDEGVLYASGNIQGGYTLFILDGHLCFEHRAIGTSAAIRSDRPVPLGESSVGVELLRAPDRSATATLLIDGGPAGSAFVPLTTAHLSFWGVGRDPVSQVSTAYTGEFPIREGVLDEVALDFLEPAPFAELAHALEHIE